MDELEQAKIKRALRIIRECNKFLEKGYNTRKTIAMVAKKLGYSEGLVHKTYFTRTYARCGDAWEIIRKEQAEKEANEKANLVASGALKS